MHIHGGIVQLQLINRAVNPKALNTTATQERRIRESFEITSILYCIANLPYARMFTHAGLLT